MDILCNNIKSDGIGLQRSDWQNFRECEDIVLNGQVIWVGLPLSSAVKSRIYEDIVTTGHHSASLAAEVWRAANAYCKAHKSAHPELTSQGKLLSNFVNSDPDLYCSLPITATPEALSAMPVRSLNGDGNATIDIPILITSNYVKAKFKMKTISYNGQWGVYFGRIRNSSAGAYSLHSNSAGVLYGNLGSTNNKSFNINKSLIVNKETEFTCDNGNITLKADGTQIYSGTYSGSIADSNYQHFGLYCYYEQGNMTWKCFNNTEHFDLEYVQGQWIKLIPHHTTTNGMLDIETLTFYGNAAATGSFTIEKS